MSNQAECWPAIWQVKSNELALSQEGEEKKQPLAVIPYVSGLSEWIRKACEKFNLKVVFKQAQCSAHCCEGPPPQGETGRCGLPDPLSVR